MAAPDEAELQRRGELPVARELIAATRRRIGRQGITAATWHGIEEEAGVAYGSLRYYFGDREHLLIETLRDDARRRIARLERRVRAARSRDQVLVALRVALGDIAGEDQSAHVFLREMAGLGLSQPRVHAAYQQLYDQWFLTFAELLDDRERQGVVRLSAEAMATAQILTAMGEGLILQSAALPDRDHEHAWMLFAETGDRLLGGPCDENDQAALRWRRP